MKKYQFVSKNCGTIEFQVIGEYRDGCKDIYVCIEDPFTEREWADVDGGEVDEMFQWLLDKGVEFESNKALWFNVHYVASVLIDGDATESYMLDAVAKLTDEEADQYREFYLQA